MAYLCDINVLLALCVGQHQHHALTHHWVNERDNVESLIVCRVTQLGLLRLLNNPTVMGSQVCSGKAAWHIYDMLLGDERFVYRSEPAGLDAALRRISGPFRFSPKAWQDAYLAAFAAASGLVIASLDSGFSSYPNVPSEHITGER